QTADPAPRCLPRALQSHANDHKRYEGRCLSPGQHVVRREGDFRAERRTICRVTECAACGHANPGASKFCNECGAPLGASTPAHEERKTVTSLFCDLVGFTAASEAADPEDVDRVLAGYFRLARAQIEAHGGVVEKFIGDAVVGVFGVPAARE